MIRAGTLRTVYAFSRTVQATQCRADPARLMQEM